MPAPSLSPVDRLRTLGAEPARRRVWPDYLALGLEPRHAPALVRMATDPALHGAPERDRAGWAPVHAWRALAQLGAPGAAEPLLELLEARIDRGWVADEVPDVLAYIGAPSIAGATLLLFDEGRAEDVRIAAARVLAGVAHEHPERRDECAAVVGKQLEDWAHQGRALNGWLVLLLADLGEAGAAPAMEAAFAAGAVDTRVCGTWEDVQVQLGLLPDESLPPAGSERGPAAPRGAASARERRKRKEARRARKRNRKR